MKPLLWLILALVVGAAPLQAQDRDTRLFQSNPPPNFGDEIESPIFVPQLLVGVRF